MGDLDGYNDDLRDLAEARGFASVDLRGHFLGHGFYAGNDTLPDHDPADPTRWFDDDCIHPNDRGHSEIRRLFLGAVDRAAVVDP